MKSEKMDSYNGIGNEEVFRTNSSNGTSKKKTLSTIIGPLIEV